jgi:hypothetical protein
VDSDAIAYLGVDEDDTSLEGLAVVRGGSLEGVLNRIASGEFQTLVLVQLRAIDGSLRGLVALLDWLEEAGGRLVALDVGLDTGSAAGRRTVAALREVARWEREPLSGRPPRGRPGLAVHAPELRRRIGELREQQGLSLQAIADVLNAEEVPTPRGGKQWRPSSVQAALGYRRPPPTPPLPPHPARKGPGGPKAHSPQRHGPKPPPPHDRPRPESRQPRRPGKGDRP